jgi:hypothetical protein
MPNPDNELLGLVLAATLLAIPLNLDWRHYCRYWIGRRIPNRLVEIIFRSFFLLLFVGSLEGLVRAVLDTPRTTSDYGYAILFSSPFMLFFIIADHFFRRYFRKHWPPI